MINAQTKAWIHWMLHLPYGNLKSRYIPVAIGMRAIKLLYVLEKYIVHLLAWKLVENYTIIFTEDDM